VVRGSVGMDVMEATWCCRDDRDGFCGIKAGGKRVLRLEVDGLGSEEMLITSGRSEDAHQWMGSRCERDEGDDADVIGDCDREDAKERLDAKEMDSREIPNDRVTSSMTLHRD